MQFNFTESDYSDAFKFGGRLEFVAETPQEIESLISHFGLFKDVSDVATLEARIAALQSATLSHTIGTDKRPVYEVNGCLDSAFAAPYVEWMQRDLGHNGPLPDLELPRKWGGLIHTNYQARVYTQDGHICFEAFTTSEPWNGKDAQTYAESRVVDCIGEEFGTRYREPEFIQAGNSNHMKRNPDYLKRHRATPLASNATLKKALFAWWLANHANDAQRAIVDGNAAIVAESGDYMSAFLFERPQSHIYHGKHLTPDGKTRDYKAISFADFAALGAE